MKSYSLLASELWFSCSRPKYQPHGGAWGHPVSGLWTAWSAVFCSGPKPFAFLNSGTADYLSVVPPDSFLHAFLNSGTAACQNYVLGRYMAFQRTADCQNFVLGRYMVFQRLSLFWLRLNYAPFWNLEQMIVNRRDIRFFGLRNCWFLSSFCPRPKCKPFRTREKLVLLS